MAGYATIAVNVAKDGVATCTFQRPEKRNALNLTMVQELTCALTALAADPSLRALIFTGAGQSFVGGADIAELKERRAEDALMGINSALFARIEQFPVPTIAAIHGYALGGGLELALACDIRLAHANAKMGQPEVALGIIPGAGATSRLPRLVGQGWARELIFSARLIDAPTAAAIGLVNRVVGAPDDQRAPELLCAAANDLARQIAHNSTMAVRLAKVALNALALQSSAAMPLESALQAVLFEQQDKHHRMQNFLQRQGAKHAAETAPRKTGK